MTIDNYLEAKLPLKNKKVRKMRKENEDIVTDNQINRIYSLGIRFHCQLSFIHCQLTQRPQGPRTL